MIILNTLIKLFTTDVNKNVLENVSTETTKIIEKTSQPTEETIANKGLHIPSETTTLSVQGKSKGFINKVNAEIKLFAEKVNPNAWADFSEQINTMNELLELTPLDKRKLSTLKKEIQRVMLTQMIDSDPNSEELNNAKKKLNTSPETTTINSDTMHQLIIDYRNRLDERNAHAAAINSGTNLQYLRTRHTALMLSTDKLAIEINQLLTKNAPPDNMIADPFINAQLKLLKKYEAQFIAERSNRCRLSTETTPLFKLLVFGQGLDHQEKALYLKTTDKYSIKTIDSLYTHDIAHTEKTKAIYSTLHSQITSAIDFIDRRVAELTSNNQELQEKKIELSQTKDKYTALINSIETVYQSRQPSPLVDEDNSVKLLLTKHQELYNQFLAEKNTGVSTRKNANTLEVDQLNADIKSTNTAIKRLDEINIALTSNLEELNRITESTEKTRMENVEQTKKALSNKIQKAQTYIDNIKTLIATINVHRPEQNAELDEPIEEDISIAENTVGLLLLTLSSLNTMPKQCIEDFEREQVLAINKRMNPLHAYVRVQNSDFISEIDRLNKRITQIAQLKGTLPLSEIIQFPLPVKLENDLNQIHRLFGAKIIPLDYVAIATLSNQIELQENIAKNLIDQSNDREDTKEATVVSNLIKNINNEITALNKENNGMQATNTKKSDPRVTILENMRTGLQTNIDNYRYLKTKNSTDFITASLSTIQTSLENKQLESLSDSVLSTFQSHLRFLLQPLTLLIKKWTGETYRPHFFAGTTETNMAKAAQAAHHQLNQILNPPEMRKNKETSPSVRDVLTGVLKTISI